MTSNLPFDKLYFVVCSFASGVILIQASFLLFLDLIHRGSGMP